MVLAPVATRPPFGRIPMRLEKDEQVNGLQEEEEESKSPSLWDGILWAVPKQRKTIERRLKSKFGVEKWGHPGYKMLKPRFDLVTCETCGNYKEKASLCLHCYNRVKAESVEIKEAMAREYNLNPVDKDWEIRYKSDPKEDVSDKILVEMDKERPSWFSKGLLTKSNEVISEKNVIVHESTSSSSKD